MGQKVGDNGFFQLGDSCVWRVSVCLDSKKYTSYSSEGRGSGAGTEGGGAVRSSPPHEHYV